MTKAIKIVAGLLIVILLAIGAFYLWENSTSGSSGGNAVTSAVDSAKNSAVNTAIDASGIKSKVSDALASSASSIASATGLDQSTVNTAISNLDVEDWQAATLPSTATATSSYSTDYNGTSAQVTTYDDPGYVTVDALGQSVTFSVPDSAQQYTSLLQYVG